MCLGSTHIKVTSFFSHSHSEWAKLDAGLGESVHGEQSGGSLPAVAGIWERDRSHSLLPRSGFYSCLRVRRQMWQMKWDVLPVTWSVLKLDSAYYSAATPWKAPDKIDLYDVRRRPWYAVALWDHVDVLNRFKGPFLLFLLQVHPGGIIPQRHGHPGWCVSNFSQCTGKKMHHHMYNKWGTIEIKA